jgi:hypothetical protein
MFVREFENLKDLDKKGFEEKLKLIVKMIGRENYDFECKNQLPDDIVRHIVGMARVNGGLILLGVSHNEETGKLNSVNGIEKSNETSNKIYITCRNLIFPRLYVKVTSVDVPGTTKEVVLVEVPDSMDNNIIRAGKHSGTHIRILPHGRGSRTHIRMGDQTHKVPEEFMSKTISSARLRDKVNKKLTSLNNGFEQKLDHTIRRPANTPNINIDLGWLNLLSIPFFDVPKMIDVSNDRFYDDYVSNNIFKRFRNCSDTHLIDSYVFHESKSSIITSYSEKPQTRDIFKRMKINENGIIELGRVLLHPTFATSDKTIDEQHVINIITDYIKIVQYLYKKYDYDGKILLCIKIVGLDGSQMKTKPDAMGLGSMIVPANSSDILITKEIYTEHILDELDDIIEYIMYKIRRSFCLRN